MPKRRHVLIGLAAEASMCGLRSHAAVSTVVKRLGILGWGDPNDAESVASERVLLESLASKGWSEGRNLLLVRSYSGTEYMTTERLAALARELIRARVDVILTVDQFAAVAAARTTDSVPIVFAAPGGGMLIEQGLIESYARPGRNVTGPATSESLGSSSKRYNYLKQLAPSATRLACVPGPKPPPVERVSGGLFDFEQVVRDAARGAGFELRYFWGHSWADPSDLKTVFEEIDRWPAQAVFSPLLDASYVRQVAKMAFVRKLPSLFSVREAIDAGGLVSYGTKDAGDWRLGIALAASYVDRIFRGANPATLPVEFPTRYDLVINAKTAAALGLSIPADLRVSAEIVG
jgi:putative ABC transport system substrate-binding protein